MTYKYIVSEKIDKKRRRSDIIRGIASFLIGLILILGGLLFLVALKSITGLIVMFIFALIFIVAGVYFLNQLKIEEKRSQNLDNPKSKLYKKKQHFISKKRENYLSKAEQHGSLKGVLCHRAALISGSITIFAWIISVILLLGGLFVFILLILDVILPILFISSLLGKKYKRMLKEYEKGGIDKLEAERDFLSSKAYFIFTDVIAVSSRFIIASAENIVLPIEKIVWIYTGYDNIHKYNNRMYSHTERKYGVIIGLSNGKQVKINCPEELCSVIENDVVRVGISVVEGYSNEIQELFNTKNNQFKNADKTEANINMKPVAMDIPSIFNNTGNIEITFIDEK